MSMRVRCDDLTSRVHARNAKYGDVVDGASQRPLGSLREMRPSPGADDPLLALRPRRR